MIRVAVLSAPGPELGEIHSLLSSCSDIVDRVYASLEEVEAGIRAFAPHVLLIRFPRFEEAHIVRLKLIRERFPEAALVAATNEIDDQARFRTLREKGLALVNTRHELHDLPELIRRLHEGSVASPRAHSRTRRTEKIELMDAKGQVVQGRFIDFGRMGAKLSVAGLDLRPNDRVLLKYSSSSQAKVRKIEAVVVWQRAPSALRDGLFGARTLGVKFIAYI